MNERSGRSLKKLLNFLRSMRFGMILLVIIILLSLAGSVIPQNNEAMWYVTAYPRTHFLILATGAYRLFSTWYFVLLVALLCGNLTLCSVVRIGRVRRQAGKQVETAAALPAQVALDDSQRQRLESYLHTAHYKPHSLETDTVWTKNHLGFYGSFLTHLGILLLFLAGAAVLYFSQVHDHSVLPGEILTLSDGTTLMVEDFRITDDTGRLDFTSHLTLTAPNGQQVQGAEISVNHPYSFKNHKFYQQTYATCGSISVRDQQGGEDTFTVDEVCFLSADGVNGIWYEALYPDYIRDENGNYTLISNTSGNYEHPLYQVLICGSEGRSPVLAMPGESITVEGLEFTFNDPISYPGIRIKTLPVAFMAALYISFVLLTFALWLCFFHVPAAISVTEEGYAIYSPKPMGVTLELVNALGEDFVKPKEMFPKTSETEEDSHE